MAPEPGRPRRRTIGLVILAGLVLAGVGAAWSLQPLPLLPEARASLGARPDTAFKKVGDDDEWMPPSMHYTVGLVVYPDAKVLPAAYGPLAQRTAAHGYLVVAVSMPANLAVLDGDAARRVMASHPEVRRWAVAGHAMGGTAAAQFIAGHPGLVRGLALWAASPAANISASGVACTSVYGTRDAGLAALTSDASRRRLPADCAFVPIEGGDGAQMGYAASQPGELAATISRDDQLGMVTDATLAMLARVQAQPDPFPPAPAGS